MSPDSERRKDETHAQYERRKAEEKDDRKKIVAALEAIAQKPCTAEHQTKAQKISKYLVGYGTLLGIWVAASVAIWAVCKASEDSQGQRDVMKGQLKEMKAEQRAWVYADIVPGSDAIYKNGNMELSFKVTLHNVGHQPVRSAFPLIYGTERERIEAQGRDERAFQFGICDPKKGMHVSERISTAEGRSVFPGQSAEVTIPVGFGDPGARYPASWGNDSFTPIVLGCIAYQFVTDGSWHQTGFIYRLERDGPFDPMLGKQFHVKEGDIKMDRLHLVSFVNGRGFYAY